MTFLSFDAQHLRTLQTTTMTRQTVILTSWMHNTQDFALAKRHLAANTLPFTPAKPKQVETSFI
jgi:hypothetical protein